MNYKIKVSYQTGDSFGNNDTEWVSELTWENLYIAKQNLQAIKEHYEMYEHIERVNSSWRVNKKYNNVEDIINNYKDKWWFVTNFEDVKSDKPCLTAVQNCMYLKTDKLTTMQQWNPWCGYFERLYGAEIIVEGDTDMKFEI